MRGLGHLASHSRPTNVGQVRFCQAACFIPPNAFRRPLDTRTEVSDPGVVKGAEFERRIQRLARRKKITCEFVADKGKGSHGRLYFGDEFTTLKLKDRKKEIGRDLLVKMCQDLKIDPHGI